MHSCLRGSVAAIALGAVVSPVAVQEAPHPPAAELRAPSPAAISFENEAKLKTAFEHLYNLEFTPALKLFEQVAHAEPQSATVRAFWASALLYEILARQGTLQSQLFVTTNEFMRFPRLPPDAALDASYQKVTDDTRRIALERVARNAEDVDGLFALGLSYGNEANYLAGVKADYLRGLRAGEKSYAYHKRLKALRPEIHDVGVVLGVHDYVIGSLPGHLRFLLFFLGSTGSRQRGLDFLEEAATGATFLRTYAQVLQVVAAVRESQMERALNLALDLRARYPRNPVFLLESAKYYRQLDRYPEAAASCQELLALLQTHPHNPRVIGPEDAYLELGQIEAERGNLEPALAYFDRATAVPEANARLLAQARMERGKAFDRLGQREAARAEFEKVIALDVDDRLTRQAKKYRKSAYKHED